MPVKSKPILLILLGVLIGFVYILNISGIPLSWSDSERYLAYSVRSELGTFGSIFYPLFLKYASLNISLWFVVFFQSLTASYILYKLVDELFDRHHLAIFTILNIVLCFSSFFYFTFTLMPDIFLSIGILANYLILKKRIEKENLLIYIIFSVCVIGHNGFAYIFLLVNSVALLASLCVIRSHKTWIKKCLLSLFLVFFSLFILKPSLSKLYEHDMRHKRDINFFCRQIALTFHDGLFEPLKEYGCLDDNSTITICNSDMDQDYYRSLVFSGNESDCKTVFLSAFQYSSFVQLFIKQKIQNIWASRMNLRFLRNSGTSPKVHPKMHNWVPDDMFINFGEYSNDQSILYRENIRSVNHVNKFLLTFSQFLFALLILYFIMTSWMKKRPNIIDPNKHILFGVFLLLSLGIAMSFYGVFSRYTNTRYVMRLSWILIIIGIVPLLDLISGVICSKNKISIEEDNGTLVD